MSAACRAPAPWSSQDCQNRHRSTTAGDSTPDARARASRCGRKYTRGEFRLDGAQEKAPVQPASLKLLRGFAFDGGGHAHRFRSGVGPRSNLHNLPSQQVLDAGARDLVDMERPRPLHLLAGQSSLREGDRCRATQSCCPTTMPRSGRSGCFGYGPRSLQGWLISALCTAIFSAC